MSNGTVRTIEYLEQAFSHGQIPTQCDFWDLIATFSDRGWADFVPLSGFSLMTGPLSTNMLFASCGNSDQWCASYSTVCANSAVWSDTNFCDKVVYLKNVGCCWPYNIVSLTGGLAMTGSITAKDIYLDTESLHFANGTGIKGHDIAVPIDNKNYVRTVSYPNTTSTHLFNNTSLNVGNKYLIEFESHASGNGTYSLGYYINGISVGGRPGGFSPTLPHISTVIFTPTQTTNSFSIISQCSPGVYRDVQIQVRRYLLVGDGIYAYPATITPTLSANTVIATSTVYANCGNSDQWCEAYRTSLSALTGVSINGVTADYSNHFASFTGLTFGDTATITAIELNGINQPPDINRVVSLSALSGVSVNGSLQPVSNYTANLSIPLSSYVPLSGNVTITNPISVDGCITADCITGLTSISLGSQITSWNNISAYYDLAGMDILPGDLLHVEYSPSAYDVVTPIPGLSAYPLSGHLAGIDSALSCISGVSAITFTNTTVASTPAKTLTNYLLIKVNGSDMYLPLYT